MPPTPSGTVGPRRTRQPGPSGTAACTRNVAPDGSGTRSWRSSRSRPANRLRPLHSGQAAGGQQAVLALVGELENGVEGPGRSAARPRLHRGQVPGSAGRRQRPRQREQLVERRTARAVACPVRPQHVRREEPAQARAVDGAGEHHPAGRDHRRLRGTGRHPRARTGPVGAAEHSDVPRAPGRGGPQRLGAAEHQPTRHPQAEQVRAYDGLPGQPQLQPALREVAGRLGSRRHRRGRTGPGEQPDHDEREQPPHARGDAAGSRMVVRAAASTARARPGPGRGSAAGPRRTRVRSGARSCGGCPRAGWRPRTSGTR